jgi:hypothetical protein
MVFVADAALPSETLLFRVVEDLRVYYSHELFVHQRRVVPVGAVTHYEQAVVLAHLGSCN